jgi:hypothetical protein
MTPQGGGQILVFVAVLIALAYPLGAFRALRADRRGAGTVTRIDR